jgi:hypothetical protein
MSKFLDDFINVGQGGRPGSLFEGDMKAIEISARLSKNQRRMYKRYGIAPAGFYIWLRESRIIRKSEPIPQGGSTIAQLLDFLRWYPYETEQARSTGEYIFRQIIREGTGLPDSAFGLGDYLLDESRCINKRGAISNS